MKVPTSFAIAFATLTSSIAFAAPPAIDYLYPAGGQQGSSFNLTVGQAKADGKIDPWPAKIWIDCPGVSFEPQKDVGLFTVTIAKDAPQGPHLLRVYNADGTSSPRMFVVGRHREVLENEKEPNNDARKPQAAGELPAVLNGRLEKNEDVDSWAIDAEAGKWITAEVACRRLGSPIDPFLQLVDPDGTIVAFNHDTFGLDPLIAYQTPRAGRYVLQIAGFANPPGSEVRFAGSKGTVYRILVTTGSHGRFTLPRAVERGKKTAVRVLGTPASPPASTHLPTGTSAFPPASPPTIDVDTTDLPAHADFVLITDPHVDNVLHLPLSNFASVEESEPNDTIAAAQKINVPIGIDGQIDHPGDVDRFRFSAKKGEKLTIILRCGEFSSTIDPVLVVSDADGKQIARDNPSAGGADAKLDFAATADGDYIVSVSDLKHTGGPACVYRLEIGPPPASGFAATVDTAAVPLQPGKSADVKVTVTRQGGNTGALKVAAVDLPEGVSASPVEVPAKGGAVTLTLKAAADATPASGPFRVMVSSAGEEKVEQPAMFALEAGLLLRSTDTIWLTVGKSAAKAEEPKKKK